VHCLRTSGCVVFVAAAGFILYHLMAGAGGVRGSRMIGLLGFDGGGGGLGAKPQGDDRKYQHSVLPNGLQVVNVQDKRAVQTAFAMAVDAGSFDDPQELPGLAHFCEHMLFLGTQKFPEASGFDNFMSANGGFNNAYTADEVTVYYGEMSQAAGKEGLDRFADFFRAPLFDKQYVSKEVHAIDSEHAKNVQDPQRRIMQVAFSLANPKSPVGAFHTGDVETLYNTPKRKGIDPVDALKIYFKSHYCPPKMRLVTYGSESTAAQLAGAKTLFQGLTSSSSCKEPRRSFATPEPWGPKRMGQFVKAQGTLPQAELWLHFTLPDVTKDYRSQPLQYIEHMLGYGGKDSLGRVLQDNLGLVTSFDTMFDMNSAGTSLFAIMHLTKPGQQNLEVILNVFYTYLGELRKKGVDEKLYDSLARINKLKWDWAGQASPSDTASNLAEAMIRLPAEHLLSGDSLIEKTNSSLVSSLIDALVPANMNVILVDPPSQNGNNASFVNVEAEDIVILPHYDVKYSVKSVDQVMPGAAKRWNRWITGAAALNVASLLPSDLVTSGTVVPVVPPAIEGVPGKIPQDHMHASKTKGDFDAELWGTRPKKLTDVEADFDEKESGQLLQASVKHHGGSLVKKGSEVWYRSGWMTTSPKVQLQLVLRPVMAKEAPEMPAVDVLRLGVFGHLLSEAMVPSMIDLTATGVSYGIDVNSKGLTFTFSGFTPMMPTLITKVLKEFNAFNGNTSVVLPARFKRVTQELRQSLETYADMPITYAIQDRNMLMSRGGYSREESVKALEKVTEKSAVSSVDDVHLSQPMQLTSLAMGNIAEDAANKAVLKFVGDLRTPKMNANVLETTGEPERVSAVVKFVRPIEVRANNPRKGDPNDAVVLSIIAGVGTLRSRVVLGLLGQILNTVAYNELRTTRQLGYVVNAGASHVSNVQYMSCIVQGNALKADDIEASIEFVFTHLMPKRLAELTDKEFAAYKHSFRQDLVQPPLKFQDEINHFWGPIAQGGQCFNLRGNMLKYVDESLPSKDALIKEWATLANPSDGMRSKIVVKYFAGIVPTRPTVADAAAIWSKQGVPDSALSLLRREYEKTNVLHHVDSKVRQQLVKEGGYFPRDLHCGLDKPAHKPSPHFLKKASPHSF